MAITFINSTAKIITVAASTWSMELHSSRLGGALYVVGAGAGSSAVTVSSVADNLGVNYTKAKAVLSPLPAASVELWYLSGVSSASTRVFVGWSGATSGGLALGQWSDISTANALGAVASSAITANSTSHSAAQIASSGLAVSFGRVQASTIGTVTVLGGMTAWVSTNALLRTVGLYQINAAQTTVTGSFTTSSNCQHAEAMAIFFDTVAVVPGDGAQTFSLLGIS